MTVRERKKQQLRGQLGIATGDERTAPANRTRTSMEAGTSQRGLTAGKRAVVLEAYRVNGAMTVEQVAAYLNWHSDSVRPRMNELAKDGVIEQCGSALTRSGRRAQLWRLVADERPPPGQRTTPEDAKASEVGQDNAVLGGASIPEIARGMQQRPSLGELLAQVYDAAPQWVTARQVDELIAEAMRRLGNARAAYAEVRDYLYRLAS